MTEEKLEDRVEETKGSKPVTAFLTYREVEGFFLRGWYKSEDRDILISRDLRVEGDYFPRELSSELLERVDQAFVYYGALSHFGETREVELERHLQYCLGEDYRTRGIKVALVSCGCCAGEIKEKAAESLGLPFLAGLRSDRQAAKAMGEIARAVLRGEFYESIVSRFKYDPVADFDPHI